MKATEQLRGMAWEHPRAVNPLQAISAVWSADTDRRIVWDARPLKDFEDQPLEELAERYDLILIDYPFVGFAASSGLIAPVEDWAEPGYLADQEAATVGPSYRSYTWRNRQWALAIDAACQVSGVRSDLLVSAQSDLPDTWDAVMNLAETLHGGDCRVAIPLNANHAYCAFLSIAMSQVGPPFWPAGDTVDRSSALASLDFLRKISTRLHPLSRDADPIAISDRMTTTDEILYVPLMFGYSSYARTGFRPNRIRFGDAPLGSGGYIGSVLGGVGIALSARSAYPGLAASLARLVGSGEMQCGLYATSGGQPGYAAAWESQQVNDLVDDFFRATRRTIEQAFLRPRVAGHRRFQELAGELIHRFIWHDKMRPVACLAEFDRLVESLLGDWQDSMTYRTAGAA
jgi:multiple sugar transport system substrate-binding protein